MQPNIAGNSVSHNAIMRDNTLGALIKIVQHTQHLASNTFLPQLMEQTI
jgi:hypothetical protein